MWPFKKKEEKKLKMRWTYDLTLYCGTKEFYTITRHVDCTDDTRHVSEKGKKEAQALFDAINKMWKKQKYITAANVSVRSGEVTSLFGKFNHFII